MVDSPCVRRVLILLTDRWIRDSDYNLVGIGDSDLEEFLVQRLHQYPNHNLKGIIRAESIQIQTAIKGLAPNEPVRMVTILRRLSITNSVSPSLVNKFNMNNNNTT